MFGINLTASGKEGVVQAAGFADDKLWTFSYTTALSGYLYLLIASLYCLMTMMFQLMAKCNNGEIGREEAEYDASISIKKRMRLYAWTE